MIHAELLLYPAVLLFITFFGAKLTPRGVFSDRALDRDQAKLIQASASIAIILHHLTQRITDYGTVPMGPISIFSDMGFFFTSIYLFFSGYGLIISLDTKEDYLKHFLRNRLPAVLIPLWITNLLGIVIRFYTDGSAESVLATGKDFLGLTLINGNAWFIIEITVLYLLFHFLFSCAKKRRTAMILMTVAVLLLMYVSFGLGHDPDGIKNHWFRGEWWYNALPAFLFGLYFGQFRTGIIGSFRRRYRILLPVFGVLTPIGYLVSSHVNSSMGYYLTAVSFGRRYALITLAVQTVSELVFLVFLILVNLKLTLGNPVLKALGTIQLMLFLVHNYFLDMVFLPMELSPFLLYGAVLLSGLLCAALLTPLNRLITKGTASLLSARRKWLVLVAVGACVALIVFGYFSRKRSKECYSEYAVLVNAEVGDVVLYGRFETDSRSIGKERVSWIVIDRTEDEVVLLSEYGLGGSYYNQKHEEVTFRDSDLHDLLNSGKYLGMFSNEEKRLLLPTGEDLVSLLTVSEAESFFASDADRELAITDVAERAGTNINSLSKANNWDMKGYRSSWWWLRGEDSSASYTAPIVTVDGIIEPSSKEVNKPHGAIRPVIRVGLR